MKQNLLKQELRGKGLKLNWNEPGETAWKSGAKFDAWHEHFDFNLWLQAFEAAELDPAFYSHRERPIDETLPWDHIDAAVKKQFLTEDYLFSQQGKTRRSFHQRTHHMKAHLS